MKDADAIFVRLNGSSHPRDVAFIAMTLYRLGRAEDARKELDRLRGLMQAERWADRAAPKRYLREAEALIPTASTVAGEKD